MALGGRPGRMCWVSPGVEQNWLAGRMGIGKQRHETVTPRSLTEQGTEGAQ